ncbi:hypothetical protein ACVR05_08000 [Streptococcus caprae]|uniref:hypothetical protein n=1 Tax=Streptococcus caprae TaxID=1640501 RepID=UPI0036D31F96
MKLSVCLLILLYLFFGGRYFFIHLPQSKLPKPVNLLLLGLFLIGFLWLIVLLAWVALLGFSL